MGKTTTLTKAYKKKRTLSDVLKILSFVCFWTFLVLSILCLAFALRNSFGNIAEIIEKLDSKKYTGEVLRQNYEYLVNKYGEWVIGNGGTGFQITFVNIGHALFSGLMIMNCILFAVCLTISILSKWLLPKIAEKVKDSNQDTVNLEILKMAENNNKEK